MSQYHIPVMLKETIHHLAVKPGSWYIDCNLGGGGHTEGILQAGGKVLGIDLDPDAIKEVATNHQLQVETRDSQLRASSENLILVQSNFADLKNTVEQVNLPSVSGVLFDLGVSSYQLEEPGRGFSFNQEAPLDMRMDPVHMQVSAKDLINGLREDELIDLFKNYGEERFAKPIAKKIVGYRQTKPIETTNELAQVILSVRRRTSADRTHPATRVFQALRIAVNDEMDSLKTALPQALAVLSPGGRLVVTSFHSLEDRIVKNFMRDEQKKGSIKIITQKPIEPSEEEVSQNPRSRSGKLRAAEKIIDE